MLASAPARSSSATLGASFSLAAIISSRSTGARPSAGMHAEIHHTRGGGAHVLTHVFAVEGEDSQSRLYSCLHTPVSQLWECRKVD